VLGNVSIAQRMKETGGHTSGFDYMRVALAIAVIGAHTTSISYGKSLDLAIWDGPQKIFPHMILPMFFSLSGFLVAGSLQRCPTLISFYGLRILRIIPALGVEVFISALLFGPLLSTVDYRAYFGQAEFYSYFLNIIGDIHYRLPGVFAENPMPAVVNGQLWTVPFELECYVALGGLAVIGILRARYLLLATVTGGQALWIWEALRRGDIGAAHGAAGPVLVLYFLTGVLFFLYR
jgi:peptidoglycan/LPS O-acetylase OafA/YrhL